MANGFITVPPDSTGKNLQTFSNSVSATTVHAEAVALVRTSDNSEIGTSSQPLRTDPTGVTTQPISIASGSIGNAGFNVTPATSGGLTDFHLVSAGSTNANNVKASAGQVFGWYVFNNAAYPVYLKFYNNSGTPTVGTGVVQTVGVQAGTYASFSTDIGIVFGTGIAISITKGIADADATAVLASDCVVDVFYK